MQAALTRGQPKPAAPSDFEIGQRYQNGIGVGIDEFKATAHYEKSCDQGDARGCNHLGIIYETGKTTTINRNVAVSSYNRGCKLGETASCNNSLRLTKSMKLIDELVKLYRNYFLKTNQNLIVLYTKNCFSEAEYGKYRNMSEPFTNGEMVRISASLRSNAEFEPWNEKGKIGANFANQLAQSAVQRQEVTGSCRP